MPVRIITDSGSEYKSSDHPALEVLPLTVAFGDDVYREGVDITYDQFYELLAEREEFPSTGQARRSCSKKPSSAPARQARTW